MTALFTVLAIVGAVRAAPLPEGSLRVRLPQADREAQDQRRGAGVQPQRRQAVRPLALADDRARRRRRRGRADQADDPQAGRSDCPGPDVDRPGGHDLRPAPGRARGAAAQAGADRADPQADPRPGAGACSNDKERSRSAKINPPAGLHELAPVRSARRSRGGRSPRVDGTIGRVVLVYPPSTGLSVWNGRDLLRIASVLQYLHLPNGKVVETSGSAVVFGVDDPLDPARRPHRHRGLADRRADHHLVHHPPCGARR